MASRRFPDLNALHERHQGLTKAVCDAYAEAAHVCLSLHHQPPVDIVVTTPEEESTFGMTWTVPGERERRAWANLIDAVEAGAYAMAIAAVEGVHQWFAVSRAETLTGADYYVGPAGADLETAFRLEVSGTNEGNAAELRARLKRKTEQALAGRSALPAVACVVGFRNGSILVSSLQRPS